MKQLGYDRQRGYYSHPDSQAILVGDFIDRGPQIRKLLGVVRPMIDNGAARAVMGNYEFNALCYHTRRSDDSGEFLRPHTAKNVHQHQETASSNRRTSFDVSGLGQTRCWSIPDKSTSRLWGGNAHG